MKYFEKLILSFLALQLAISTAESGKCRAPRRLAIPFGLVNSSSTSYTEGTTLTFDCIENYYLDGPDSMTCTPTGWKPKMPPRCQPIQCLDPGNLANGRVQGSRFEINRVVKFGCQAGFTLKGSKERICQKDGTWSGDLAVCDDGKSDCGNPGIPISGRRKGKRFNVGDVVKFACLDGLILRGSEERLCTQNKTWTGKQAFCERRRSFYIPPLNETALNMLKNVVNPLSKNSCTNWVDGCTSRGRSISINPSKGLDLVFLIDSSSSIGKENFDMGLKFACELIKRFGVDYSAGGTRIAMITYSSRSDLVYNLGEASVDSIRKACEKTLTVAYSGGGTGTRFGLAKARDMVIPVMRRDSVRAMIIIADGRSNFGGNPYNLAKSLRTVNNLDIYAIGVGKKISMIELRLLTAKSSNCFQLKTYKDFDKLMDKIISYDYSVCGKSQFNEIKGRIFGGKKASLGQWPWQISICIIEFRKNKFHKCQHRCGGSLIEKDMILTAAHCFDKRNAVGKLLPALPHEYRVKIGQVTIDQAAGKLTKYHKKIGTILQHPSYDPIRLDNDIALIKLTTKTEWTSTIRPICLPKANHITKPDTKGYVAGWGNNENGTLADKLRYVSLRVKSPKACENKLHYYNDKIKFCAGQPGQDSCKGDSGGSFVSLVADEKNGEATSWTAVGIVSSGERCVLKKFKGYYTRVAQYMGWILKTMDKLST